MDNVLFLSLLRRRLRTDQDVGIDIVQYAILQFWECLGYKPLSKQCQSIVSDEGWDCALLLKFECWRHKVAPMRKLKCSFLIRNPGSLSCPTDTLKWAIHNGWATTCIVVSKRTTHVWRIEEPRVRCEMWDVERGRQGNFGQTMNTQSITTRKKVACICALAIPRPISISSQHNHSLRHGVFTSWRCVFICSRLEICRCVLRT